MARFILRAMVAGRSASTGRRTHPPEPAGFGGLATPHPQSWVIVVVGIIVILVLSLLLRFLSLLSRLLLSLLLLLLLVLMLLSLLLLLLPLSLALE